MTRAQSKGEEHLPQRGHLLALDGVRGLAILMVMCSHAFESNYESAGPVAHTLGTVFYYGYFGVDLFFVLSGFLITGILLDSLQDEGYFRKFYVRRALRIFPLYYGVLLVLFLMTPFLHLVWGDMAWLLPLYLQNLRPLEIKAFSPGLGIGLFHFWSLAIEEQFYLVWPAVIFLARKPRNILLITLVGSLVALALRLTFVASGGQSFDVHVGVIFRADSLLLGGTLALLYRSPAWQRVLRWAPIGFLTAAALIVASVFYLNPYLASHPLADGLWQEGLRYSLLAPGFACLIAWSLRPASATQSFFQFSWLRFLGKYSYGLYVLHIFVLNAVRLPLRAWLNDHTHNKMLSVVVSGCTVLLLSIAAAYLSYHLYERPFLRLKHRFDYKRPSLNHGSPEDAGMETVDR